MGSCASSLHNSSIMKIHISSRSNREPDNHVPVEEKLPIINGNVAVKPQCPPLQPTANSRDSGNIEEAFFDSQTWLDSDCESDFMSVNGEFVPSRGNTPLRHDFSTGTPHMNHAAPSIDSQNLFEPPLSPVVKKKKRLSELFSERESESRESDVETKAVGGLEVAAVRGGGLKPKKKRWVEIVQVHDYCLPRVQTQVRRKKV